MSSVILFCKLCGTGYASVGELPIRCVSCNRETKWSTSPPHASGPPLPLSIPDRRFLRSLRIAADD